MQHENVFLYHVLLANLSEENTEEESSPDDSDDESIADVATAIEKVQKV